MRSIVIPPVAMSHMHTATVPPGRVTRAISRTPWSGSAMNPMTSEDSAASNRPSRQGSSSATPTRTSAPGLRSVQASANCAAGSIAATFLAPVRAASSAARPPGPHPTSTTRIPAVTSAASASATAKLGV